MRADEIESLERRRKYLDEWVRRHKEAQRIVPFVQSNLESTNWAILALTNEPKEADEMPQPEFAKQFNEENDYIEQVVPMMPHYDVNMAMASTAVTSASSSDVYLHVATIGDLGTEAARQYSDFYTRKYVDLQQKQKRQSRTRALVSRLGNRQTLDRFDRASAAYSAWRAGSAERTAAANEMRNLIYGIKGDLFEAASKGATENMTWQKMAERLAKGGPGSPDAQQLLRLQTKNSKLIGDLSAPAKDREGQASVDLNHLWIRVIDHAYALLTLADVETD